MKETITINTDLSNYRYNVLYPQIAGGPLKVFTLYIAAIIPIERNMTRLKSAYKESI